MEIVVSAYAAPRVTKKDLTTRRDQGNMGVNSSVLPQKMTEPSGELKDFSILIHGDKKIGKTSLANQGGKTLFLQFDPPQLSLRRLEVVCKSWKTFKNAVLELASFSKKDFPYDRVCLDRADLAFKACEDYILEKLGITKMSEEPYGGAWALLDKEFNSVMQKLLALPCGRWFLCHSTTEVIEDRHGEEVEKLVPHLNRRADACLNGTCDAWFAYTYEKGQRKLVLVGDDRIGAGHRMDQHFRTTTGERIKSLTMPDTAEASYKLLEQAFNNKCVRVDGEKGGEKPKTRIRLSMKK